MIDQVATVLDGLSRREWFVGENDLVFCNDVGDHFDDSALRRRFYTARSGAGLKRIRFHDLRHTFGTLAVQVFPLSDVKAYMGHADIATTMIYVHHVPQLDAADRLSRALRAAAGVESTSAVDALLELEGRDVIRVLEAQGWYLERQRGSHRIFRHETRPGTVTVAGKPSTDIPPGTLGSIRRQAGLEDELR